VVTLFIHLCYGMVISQSINQSISQSINQSILPSKYTETVAQGNVAVGLSLRRVTLLPPSRYNRDIAPCNYPVTTGCKRISFLIFGRTTSRSTHCVAKPRASATGVHRRFAFSSSRASRPPVFLEVLLGSFPSGALVFFFPTHSPSLDR